MKKKGLKNEIIYFLNLKLNEYLVVWTKVGYQWKVENNTHL